MESPSSNTVTLPSWSNPQMDTMGNLALLQFMHIRKDPLPANELAVEFPEGESERSLRLLDWIATAFVREAEGDAVATALSAAPGAITLYLAANRGRPEEVDKAFANKFLQEFRSGLRLYTEDPTLFTANDSLLKCVMDFTSERFLQKLEAIKDMKPLSRKADSPIGDVEAQFRALVTKRAESSFAVEEKQDLHEYVCKFFPDAGISKSDPDGSASLIVLFQRLLSSIKEKKKKSDKYVFFKDDKAREALRFALHAMSLAETNFFRTIEHTDLPCFTSEEMLWLRKLKRRLWRVARYLVDGHLLRSVAFPIFKKLLGKNLAKFVDEGEGVDIVWVGDDRTALSKAYQWDTHQWPVYEWPDTPLARFQELLKLHNVSDDEIPDDPEIIADLEKTWYDKVEPRLHCEIQLIKYLEREGITVMENMVGVSKLMCYPCNKYLEDVNRTRISNKWVLLGCSHKYYAAWLIPDDSHGAKVVQTIQDRVGVELDALVRQSLRKRSNSGGSDSSGGSSSRVGGNKYRKTFVQSY